MSDRPKMTSVPLHLMQELEVLIHGGGDDEGGTDAEIARDAGSLVDAWLSIGDKPEDLPDEIWRSTEDGTFPFDNEGHCVWCGNRPEVGHVGDCEAALRSEQYEAVRTYWTDGHREERNLRLALTRVAQGLAGRLKQVDIVAVACEFVEDDRAALNAALGQSYGPDGAWDSEHPYSVLIAEDGEPSHPVGPATVPLLPSLTADEMAQLAAAADAKIKELEARQPSVTMRVCHGCDGSGCDRCGGSGVQLLPTVTPTERLVADLLPRFVDPPGPTMLIGWIDGDPPGTAHGVHRYDGRCAICRCADEPAALAALADHLTMKADRDVPHRDTWDGACSECGMGNECVDQHAPGCSGADQ